MEANVDFPDAKISAAIGDEVREIGGDRKAYKRWPRLRALFTHVEVVAIAAIDVASLDDLENNLEVPDLESVGSKGRHLSFVHDVPLQVGMDTIQPN